jgi:N-acyl homoserine lactone hydrolase
MEFMAESLRPPQSRFQRMADILAKKNAELWISHDKVQRDSLKMAPGFYE